MFPLDFGFRIFDDARLCDDDRNVTDPRALAAILEKAEADLEAKKHPDPYIRAYTSIPLSYPFAIFYFYFTLVAHADFFLLSFDQILVHLVVLDGSLYSRSIDINSLELTS